MNNPTRLSGNIGSKQSVTDNSSHVLIIDTDVTYTEIKGVWIQDGYANGCHPFDQIGSALLLFSHLYMYDCNIQHHVNAIESPIYTIPTSKLFMWGCTLKNNVSGTGTSFSHAPGMEILVGEDCVIE